MRDDKTDNLLVLFAIIISISLITVVMIKPFSTDIVVDTLTMNDTFVNGGEYTMSLPIQITYYGTDENDTTIPKIWDDTVVYINQNSTPSSRSLFVYYINNKTYQPIVLLDATNNWISTSIFQDIVCYNNDVPPFGLYYVNLTNGTTTLVYSNPYSYSIGNDVSSNEIAYEYYYQAIPVQRDVYYYSIINNTHVNISNPSPLQEYHPKKDKNLIAYSVYNSSVSKDVAIAYYNILNDTTVYINNTNTTTNNGFRYVSISGDNIVWWQQYTNNTRAILLYNIQTDEISTLINYKTVFNPTISGNFVIWPQFMSGHWDYIIYDLNTDNSWTLFENSTTFVVGFPSISDIYTDDEGNAKIIVDYYELDEPAPYGHTLYLLYLNKTDFGHSYQYRFEVVKNYNWIYLTAILITCLAGNVVLLINYRKEWWWT